MFKSITFAASVVCSVSAIDTNPLDTFTCTTSLSDKTTFQLKDLYTEGGYTKDFHCEGNQ